ncbi:MAG: hemin uptake protein HemP [Pseudomonadota bacterium]
MEQNSLKKPHSSQTQLPVVAAKALFGDNREVRIEFRGELYSLRITKNDKLILTK